MATHPEVIEIIRDFPAKLSSLIHGLAVQQLITPYIAGEWTIAQNIHHVADVHLQGFARCKLITTLDNPTLQAYNVDDLAALPDATHSDVDFSLDIIRGVHYRWSILLANLTEEGWQRTGQHSKVGMVTLEAQMDVYSKHGASHLKQISDVLEVMRS